ncbi:histidine phosphatase family protein [Nocardia camponoti]|uniref:Histidine phosphatase family protein n=1 Tax=Nocardia camponoti TaxID=1616106 RepID=A0A917QFT1_9NOCA|nr:phosphoglycerate mutase family protein [Nocardia camponoti]GGK48523.1 hypothetical protein GCM10011591_19890 [Nocardia camponoti]
MTTYLLRHAPTTYSVEFRLNGDPAVEVPLTSEGLRACQTARNELPTATFKSAMTSPFHRCRHTAERLTPTTTTLLEQPLLAELDYGVFEGADFTEYAIWLAEHGPDQVPPNAQESQRSGILRMMHGLNTALDWSGPRLVVAHGLLVSVIQWTRRHPNATLADVFFPAAAGLVPVAIGDHELRCLTTRLIGQLENREIGENWRVDLGAFPPQIAVQIPTSRKAPHA